MEAGRYAWWFLGGKGRREGFGVEIMEGGIGWRFRGGDLGSKRGRGGGRDWFVVGWGCVLKYEIERGIHDQR